MYYDDREIVLDNEFTVLLSLAGWSRKDKIWSFNNGRFSVNEEDLGNYWPLLETFNLLQYDYFDVKDREVVDIGSNIGDSSIFFALKGAKKVYAFEPLPAAYQKLVENIKLNGLEDKIIAFNAAVGSKGGKIKVPSNLTNPGFSINGFGDVEIPIHALSKILDIVSDQYLIKVDCEGCEADLILNDTSIHNFENIIFEHHAFMTKVNVKRLLQNLTDYKCDLKPANPLCSKEELGLVYCIKRKRYISFLSLS